MERALTGTLSLVPSYIYWHYAKATRRIWQQACTFAWFFWNFFSIGLLARTFFAPWWREKEPVFFSFRSLFSWDEIRDYLSGKLMDFIVLLFGVVVRGVVIVFGICTEIILFIIAALFFLVWLVLPVLVFYFLFAGIVFLLHPLPL